MINRECVTNLQNNMVEIQRSLQEHQMEENFIFNTLNLIKCAVTMDENQLACRYIDDFAKYVRYNLNVFKLEPMVVFTRELEQIKAYTNIETARYLNIHVVYEIEEENFYIPAMSIQPLVHNAIYHGVRSKMMGGNIRIRSYCEEERYVIEIEDDGVGFVIEEVEHRGGNITVIRNYLEQMVKGTLELKSIPDEGTIARVKIPMEKARKRE